MKINTDGVLLGALATANAPQFALDIGTGTGVVAMMIAQRFAKVTISAIDIDVATCNLAQQNFQNSIFKDRIQASVTSFQDYFNSHPESKYDLIVSNPPFFIDALPSRQFSKKIARHTDIHFFEELIEAFSKYLSLNGSAWLILPCELAQKVQLIANVHHIFVQKMIHICSFTHSKPHRMLIEIGRLKRKTDLESLIIYSEPKTYSEQYKSLLKDFLTIF